MALRVIGTGFGRTGTDSMREALNVLGFGPCHHMSGKELLESIPSLNSCPFPCVRSTTEGAALPRFNCALF